MQSFLKESGTIPKINDVFTIFNKLRKVVGNTLCGLDEHFM